jgi:hypothetical protein
VPWLEVYYAQIVFQTSLEYGGGVGELMRFQQAFHPHA